MKTRTLLTTSAIVLMAGASALAKEPVTTGGPAKAQQGSVKQDIKNAWEDIKEDSSHAYEKVKATIIGDESGATGTVTIDMRMTAAGMIGKPIYNGKNERVGTVKDIILNKEGDAAMVVVADGEFPGFSGKLAAFDYNAITQRNEEGDVIMPLTEEMIDKATGFSYDKNEESPDVRVLSSNGYSVNKLLDGALLNQKRETVAQVDNISFKNGQADQLIVAFDQTLGLGGERAALSYDNAKLVRDGEDVDFQLSATQSAQFESYKKTVTN